MSSDSIKKIAVVSLGCAKNLVNSEQMMYLLNEAGFDVTGDTGSAGIVVVNTCGFIESAKAEAIDTILEFGREKDEGRIEKLIVAGCLPERYKEEVLTEIPEIDAILGTGRYDDIAALVKSVIAGGDKQGLFGGVGAPVSETRRIITTSDAWAYLKVAEGCDNRCAYCVIPDIRGRFRSRPIERITGEARGLASRGMKELIIVAQDVTRYGLDLYGKRRLTDLLAGLCDIDGLEWIRLHYLYPDDIDEALIDIIAGNEKILNYIDMPIQHISDKILGKMRRRGSGREIRALIRRLRERIPGVVLRSCVITGLPGEGDAEFEELCDFLSEAGIERAGVFPFSPEEGADAALMEYPDVETAENRAQIVAELQMKIADDFNMRRLGSMTRVLIDFHSEGKYYGRSYAESPDVDGYIEVRGDNVAVGRIVDVRITGMEGDAPIAEVSAE